MITKRNPSEQQQKIINYNGNLVITANPGSGKTYTIVEKIKKISKDLLSYQGIIGISFTKKASQELKLRYENSDGLRRNHFFGTIDSFCLHEILLPFAKFITHKCTKLCTKEMDKKDLESVKLDKEFFDTHLKQGIIFLPIIGETALYVLNNVPECICYLKARYKYIFIDEYQDCGKSQHDIFLKLVNNGITGVAVGDINQAIFAFSNRYSKYLEALTSNTTFKHLSITKNFRCDSSISNYSLSLLGINKNISANINNSKVFEVDVEGNDRDIMKAIDKHLATLKNKYSIKKNSDFAILCKSNSSVQRAGKFLITKNKTFTDTYFDKIFSSWANMANDLLNSFFLYKESKITALEFTLKYFNENGNKKTFSNAYRNTAEIFAFSENELCKSVSKIIFLLSLAFPNDKDTRVRPALVKIFANPNSLANYKPASPDQINILTLHKSKGLEFNCVFLLDLYKYIFPPEYPYANKETYNQYLNLHYVGITRAIDACYIMCGTKRYRDRPKDYITAKKSPFLYLNNVQNLRKILKW